MRDTTDGLPAPRWYSEARERNHRALELLGEAAGLLRLNAKTMTDLGLSRHTHDQVANYAQLADDVADVFDKLAVADTAEAFHWQSRERGDAEVLSIARAFVCNPDESAGAA